MEDDISMATQACHLSTRTSFKDVGASTQEDFDSVTSVMADVVKMTDAKLNLMLTEGGGEHAKNRFGDKTNESFPISPSARCRIYQPTAKCRFEDGLIS